MKPAPKSWFRVIRAADDNAEILIYDQIGKGFWDDSGYGAKEFAEALKQIPPTAKITLRVNSPGGNVWDGLAIYHQLKARENTVAIVDGVAASIASIIVMGAKTIQIPKNALLMVHDPSGLAYGTAEDMRKAAAELDKARDNLASIYAERSGASLDTARAWMQAETWFDGQEAVDYGLADETTEQLPMAASFDFSRCKNTPPNLNNQNQTMPPTTPPNGQNQPSQTPPTTPTATTPAPAQPQAIAPAAPPAPEPTPPAPAIPAQPVTPEAFAALVDRVAREHTARVTAQVDALLANRPTLHRETWVRRALADETILTDLASLPTSQPPAPVPHGIAVGAENVLDHVRAVPQGRERWNYFRNHWEDLMQAASSRHRSDPQAVNTLSSSLTTDMLAAGTITVLTNRWAALSAFTRNFGTDPMKPKATVQVGISTVGPTAQTDPTNWESGNSTVDNVGVTVNQYSSSVHLTNEQLNSGFLLSQIVELGVASLANKVMDIALAPATVANFTATPITSAYAALSREDLKTLWGQLKKSAIKNIVLDGEYYARFLPEDRFQWDPMQPGAFGWDTFALNTRWDGAGTNVRGIACHPQAIACAAGLPVTLPQPLQYGISTQTVTLPGLGISVALCQWGNLAARQVWNSWDVMFGAAKADGNAAVLIKTA